MSDLTINDLRVQPSQQSTYSRPLTPAEFDVIARDNGYVKITEDCGECENGERMRFSHDDGTAAVYEPYPCPVCDASGKVLKDGAVDSIVVQILRAFNFDSADEDVADAAVRAGIASWLEGASDVA